MSIDQEPKTPDLTLDPIVVEQELKNQGRLNGIMSPRLKEKVVAGVIKVRELAAVGGLNEERRAVLLAGPGLVTNPVPQTKLSELGGNINNYDAHFGEGYQLAEEYQRRPAFQRFGILYPELSAYLFSVKQDPDMQDNPVEMRQILGESYDLMSDLLDMDDPYVVVNGQVTRNDYLRG